MWKTLIYSYRKLKQWWSTTTWHHFTKRGVWSCKAPLISPHFI